MSTPSAIRAAGATNHRGRSRSRSHGERRLVAMVAASSSRLMRLAAHPVGASLCLAVGYMVLCTTYILLSGRIAADASRSMEQLHRLESVKGLAFVLASGVGYFAFASSLLKRIASQQQHLALIFQGVSDSLFLVQVEADDRYRFVCVNASFLRVSGLQREQVDGRRIEEVVPETSLARVKARYREAILSRRPVSWEERTDYPAGRRVGEVTVTPLVDKAGRIHQLAGVVRDITERTLAGQKSKDYGRRLRVLSRRLVEVQETERRNIARELHDEIGQSLTVAQLNLQGVLQSPGGEALAPRLTESLAAVERVLEQVQDISLNLRPSMLDDLGLEPTLRWYTNRQGALTGLQARFVSEPFEPRLEPFLETECFRVAQEALTNVARHARAGRLSVEVRARGNHLHLHVRDDGIGFDVARVREAAVRGASLGLLSMEERAVLAGGGLDIRSAPGRGTEVHAWFPLRRSPPLLTSESA